MNFGGFLDSNSVGTVGSGAKIVADIPYTDSSRNNINVNGTTTTTTNMPTSAAISQPRLATQPLTKSMFSSPGLSLALVRYPFDAQIASFLSVPNYILVYIVLILTMFFFIGYVANEFGGARRSRGKNG